MVLQRLQFNKHIVDCYLMYNKFTYPSIEYFSSSNMLMAGDKIVKMLYLSSNTVCIVFPEGLSFSGECLKNACIDYIPKVQ